MSVDMLLKRTIRIDGLKKHLQIISQGYGLADFVAFVAIGTEAISPEVAEFFIDGADAPDTTPDTCLRTRMWRQVLRYPNYTSYGILQQVTTPNTSVSNTKITILSLCYVERSGHMNQFYYRNEVHPQTKIYSSLGKIPVYPNLFVKQYV